MSRPTNEDPPTPAGRRRFGRWRGRALALVFALAPFALLEAGLRAAGLDYPPLEMPISIWGQERDQELRAAEALHRFDAKTMWAPRGDAVIPWALDQRTSPAGFRGDDPDPAATLRVLALGDSSTFGYGVRDDETYAEGLERRLAAAFPGERVQVLNGGIVGATILQGIPRYRGVRARWVPDLVVSAFGAVNEHWPVVGMDDTRKLEYLAERETWMVRVGRALRAHVRLAHLGAWLMDRVRGGREEQVAAFGDELRARIRTANEYLEHPEYPRRVSPQRYAEALAELRRAVTADGASLLLLAMPRPQATEERLPPVRDYDPVVHSFAAAEGVPLVDGRAAFREAGRPEDALFCDAYHPSALGQDLLAERLFAAIREHGRLGGADAVRR